MKTNEKTKFNFERQSQHQRFYQYFENVRDLKKIENQNFIVPWQMDNTKKVSFR